MFLPPSDFDDSTGTEDQPSGLAATQVLSNTPAAANLIAGTSTNPLDDLVSIFGNANMGGPPATPAPAPFAGGAFAGLGGIQQPMSPAFGAAPTPKPNGQQQQSEDLLGLF